MGKLIKELAPFLRETLLRTSFLTMMTVAEKSTTLFVPAEAMGLVIGKKGATFSSLRATEGLSHCRLVTDRLNGSTLELQGTPLAVASVLRFVEQVIARLLCGCTRNPVLYTATVSTRPATCAPLVKFTTPAAGRRNLTRQALGATTTPRESKERGPTGRRNVRR